MDCLRSACSMPSSVFRAGGLDVEKGKTPLGERVTLRWKELPLVVATVACILGVVLSLIWGYNSYAIIFGAGTGGCMFAFYQARINFGLEGVRDQLKDTATELGDTATELGDTKGELVVLKRDYGSLNDSFRATEGRLEVTEGLLAVTEDKLRERNEEYGRLNTALSKRLVSLGISAESLVGLPSKFDHLMQNDDEFRRIMNDRYVELGAVAGRLEGVQEQLSSATERQEKHASNLERLGGLFAGKMMEILRATHVVTGANEQEVEAAAQEFGGEVAQIMLDGGTRPEVNPLRS